MPNNGLTPLGVAQYNGFTFGPYSLLKSLSGRYLWDKANRTIVATEWDITILDRITASSGQTIDATLEHARQLLSVPAAGLVFQNKGFGDLTINAPGPAGTKWDQAWGPHPQAFRFRILGRDQAAEIEWRVTCTVPEMCINPAYQFAYASVDWSMEISFDKLGYSTRTISIEITIPMTRPSSGTRTMPDTVENYFNNIVPTVPRFFRPGATDRSYSEDKRTLRARFVHEEMPPIIPQLNVADVEVSHEVASVPGRGLLQYSGTFYGSYTMARDYPRQAALLRFLELCTNRLAITQTGPIVPGSVIPLHFSMSEDIFGKGSGRFALGYAFTLNRMADLFGASALWQPVPGSDWNQWSQSLQYTAFAARGNAGLGLYASDDVIIDVCATRSPSTPSTMTTLQTAPDGPFLQSLPPSGGVQNIMSGFFPPPSPAFSWLKYTSEIELAAEPNQAVMKPLPDQAPQSTTLTTTTLSDLEQSGPPSTGVFERMGGQIINTSNADQVQTLATPSYEMTLRGMAIRAQYPIDPPVVISVGGAAAVPAGGSFRYGLAASVGMPVYYAVWELRYLIPAAAAGATAAAPVNPTFGQ